VKFIKQSWVLIRNKFGEIKGHIAENFFVKRIVNNRFVVLFLRFRAFISSSLLGFSAFVLCNWAFLAVIRWVYMWYSDRWDFLNTYYYITGSSFVFILIIIFVRYLATKNIFKRVLENRVKRDEFEKLVIESNSLYWTGKIKRYGGLLLLLGAIPTVVTGSPISSLATLSVYLFSSAYIDYFVRKTRIPENLLRQPPQFYFRLYEKYFTINSRQARSYGSRALSSDVSATIRRVVVNVYNNPKPVVTAVKLVTSVATALISADATVAALDGKVTLMAQGYSLQKHGCYSSEPSVFENARQLEDWGIDITALCSENSKELDSVKVNELYAEQYGKRYKTLAQRQLEEELSRVREGVALFEQKELAFGDEIANLREKVALFEQKELAFEKEMATMREEVSRLKNSSVIDIDASKNESVVEKPAVNEKEGLTYMD
jgi:hypothetical protein